MTKKAILWDNDGILVDTEKYFFKATKNTLKTIDYVFTKSMFIESMLIEGTGPWNEVKKLGFSQDKIMHLKRERDLLYELYLKNSNILINGVKRTVARLSKKYSMCIVTSSPKEHFNIIHERTGLLKYFDFCLTCEDYKKPKPDPEPYMMASRMIGYSPELCVSIEDSRRGLISSNNASIDCIIVPNSFTINSNFSEAKAVVKKLCDVEKILL